MIVRGTVTTKHENKSENHDVTLLSSLAITRSSHIVLSTVYIQLSLLYRVQLAEALALPCLFWYETAGGTATFSLYTSDNPWQGSPSGE